MQCPFATNETLFTLTVRPVIIVETPMVYARRNQNEPIILECLIEAYPQGVHFWEHDRGKYFIPNLSDCLDLMIIFSK